MKRPSFQFYPGDWLNDAALRMCSVAAQGLWINMLCYMHQGSQYGYLKVNHSPILPPNLARLVGATLEEVEGWLSELGAAGVYSVEPDGCIFSKRMVRDEQIRSARAAGGILGGNPALIPIANQGKKEAKGGHQKVNLPQNLPQNLPPTPSSSSSSSSSQDTHVPQAAPDRTPDCPHQEIIALYRKHLPDLPQPRKSLWDKSENARALKARWVWVMTEFKEDGSRVAATTSDGLSWFDRFFAHVAHSDFLNGRSGTWSADLGWLVKAKNFSKVVQGNYDNKKQEATT